MSSKDRQAIADMFERFLAGTASPWEWDDFTSVRQGDSLLEDIRKRCLSLDSEFPPDQRGEFSSERGREELRKLAALLRVPGPQA